MVQDTHQSDRSRRTSSDTDSLENNVEPGINNGR